VQLLKIVLALVCTIPAGVVIGVFVSYLVFRFVDNYPVTLLAVFRVLFAKRPKTTSSSHLASPSDKKHKAFPAIQELSTPPRVVKEPARVLPTVEDRGEESLLGLLAELKRNCKTAKEFSGDNLVPLQTDVWGASQHTLRRLHANLRNDLERIYADIGLLNHLVWFSSEFHSHSPSLHEQYVKLLMSIADRLDKIIRVPLSHFTSGE
jgi:uncharacterized protein YneF (UPF0154 family)